MKQLNDRTIDKRRLLFATILVVLGILFRTTWHLAPNVEFVTTATLLSAAYLGRQYAIAVPLAIMFFTDLIIGNTNIFLFTWSAYLLIGIAGYSKFKVGALWASSKFKVMKATGMGIVASLWFYLWTNFGVWLLDSWNMYPKTLDGLTTAYILGVPFLKFNFLGNLLFVPLSFSIIEMAKSKREILSSWFTTLKHSLITQ